MMTTGQSEKIQEIIQNLMSKMGCSGSLDFIEYPDNLCFTIRTRDAGVLIGENGEHLSALNHLVKKMVDKQVDRFYGDEKNVGPRFFIDVNDYRKQKTEELKDLARLTAQRVRYFKKEIILRPMTAYERRVVHTVLTEYPDIITESTGDAPNRRVVIKPF